MINIKRKKEKKKKKKKFRPNLTVAGKSYLGAKKNKTAFAPRKSTAPGSPEISIRLYSDGVGNRNGETLYDLSNF